MIDRKDLLSFAIAAHELCYVFIALLRKFNLMSATIPPAVVLVCFLLTLLSVYLDLESALWFNVEITYYRPHQNPDPSVFP